MTDRGWRWNEWAPRYIADLMHDFNLADWQASAFPGNFAPESGWFKLNQEIHPLVPGSKGGLGHGQWTGVGTEAKPGRRRIFESLLKRRGWKVDSYEANYTMLFLELSGAYKTSVLERVRKSPTLENATWVVGRYYENPKVLNLDKRIACAREALALYRAHPVPPTQWPGTVKDQPIEETKMPNGKSKDVTADPPALPWYQSPVFTGAAVAALALWQQTYQFIRTHDFATMASNDLLQVVMLGGGAIGATVALWKRYFATAQPIFATKAGADEHTAKIEAEPSAPEPEAVESTAPVPMTAMTMEQLHQELPQVVNMLAGIAEGIVPGLSVLRRVSDALTTHGAAELPAPRE